MTFARQNFIFFLRFLLPQSFESLGPLQDLFVLSTRVYMSVDKDYHLSFTLFKSYHGGLTLCGCQVTTKLLLHTSSKGLEIKNPLVSQEKGSLMGKGEGWDKKRLKQSKTKGDLFSISYQAAMSGQFLGSRLSVCSMFTLEDRILSLHIQFSTYSFDTKRSCVSVETTSEKALTPS